MLTRLLLECTLAAGLLSWSALCAAQPAHEIGFDLRRDLALTGSLAALNLAAALAWPAPREPRWARVSDFDLQAASTLGAQHAERADRASDVLLGVAIVAGPALALFAPRSAGRDGWAQRGLEDLVVLGEAALSAGLVAQIAKKSAARRRPAIHFDATDDESDLAGQLSLRDNQRFTSFYSGHASVTASIGAALVTLSYLRGYAHRHLAAALFGALSLVTGSLRMVARLHWTSDVLAGWAIGAGFGVGVPLLHELVSQHRRARAAGSRVHLGAGPRVQLSWVF